MSIPFFDFFIFYFHPIFPVKNQAIFSVRAQNINIYKERRVFMARRFWALALGAALIFGIWQFFKERKQGPTLVSQICVEVGPEQYVYQDPEKLSLVLNRLRSLGQQYAPDRDPEALDTQTVRITLVRSDGSRQLYQLKPDRYIRTGEGPWRQADPKRIRKLDLLLQALPGDVVLAIQQTLVL